MLSNTARPKYFDEWVSKLYTGKEPACKEIWMEVNRIESLIANPEYYYDDLAVEGWISFCEENLTLVDGSDFEMLDTFKLWGEEIFGWYEFVTRSVFVPEPNGPGGHYVQKRIKKRLINYQYLIVGRGAAKSLYSTFVQSYFLIIDGSTTNQIATAPTMRQADEVLSPIRTAIARAKSPLMKFLTDGSLQNTTGDRTKRQKLASTKKGVQNFITESILEIRPMSIDKLQGSRCKIASFDEWLSGDIRENPIEAIAQSARKNKEWLIIATSSEGTVRNSIGDSIKMELMSILRGEYLNPHVSIFYYKLDDVKEVGDPSMWKKANPNLGKTVQYDDYQQEVEKAEASPMYRNDILAKRFGIPMEGLTYFFTYEETLTHPNQCFKGMDCSMGADMSQGDDFCAFAWLFPLNNARTFGVKVRSYISSLTYEQLHPAMRDKYQDFLNEGSLVIMDGSILDMDEVYEDVDAFVDRMQYNVCSFGYDPYNAEGFMNRWALENGDWGIEMVKQGARTESVPLGEIKKLAMERELLFDEELLKWTMGNCITMEDTNGNRKLMKKHRDEKIDNVAALLDAFVAYKRNKDKFE